MMPRARLALEVVDASGMVGHQDLAEMVLWRARRVQERFFWAG